MNKKLLNSIALTLTLAKQGNKKESASVERFTNSVETYNVLDENVTSSTDAEKIRPITMGLNVIGSSEGAEVTDSEKNLTLHWDDVWDEIVNISSDSPDIVAEFDNLSIILKQIDQLVSVSNFEEAGSKTTQFLTYIKTLPGKYGSAVKYSQLEETIAQGIGKLFYDASKKKILVDLNDDYLSFLLKGFEKVKEFTAPKVGTHHKVDHQHFNANTYEFTYYSGKLGSQDKKGTFLVVKNEEPIGTYRGTFEGCSRIINHLMFQPHMLGYKKDALQGWIKNAGEVAIQNVFFDSVEDAQEWQKTQEDKAKEYNENQSEGIPNATGPDGKATPPIPGSNDPNKNKDNLKEDLMNSPGSNAPVDSLRESVPDMQKDRMDFEHRQTKPLANKNKYKNQLESSTEEIIVRDVGAEVKRLKPFSNSEYVKGKVTDIVSKDFAKVKWDDGSISISRIDSMIWSTKTKLNHRIAVSTQEGTAWVRRILEPMDYEDDEQVKAILNSSSSVDERVDKVVDRIKEISVASSDEDAIIQSVDWDTINVSMSDIISMIEDHDDDRVIEKEYQDKHESSKYGSLLKKSFNINTKHATILRKAYSGDAEVDKSFETPEYTVPANSLDFQAGLKLVTRNYPGLLTPMAMYIMKKCVDENKPILLTGANYDTEVGYNDISVDVGTTGLGIAVATAFYKDKIITCHLDNWDGLFVRCYAKTRDKAKEWMSEFENKLITENQYRGKCLYATDNALAFQDIPKVAWDDVILDEKVKKDIRLNTVSFLGDIKLAKAGVSKRGLILYGPPGTGKTSVVKAVFSELGNNNVSRVYVTAESFYKMKASGLFDILSYLGPTVLAFEDIDMVGTSRDLMIGGGNLLGDLLTNLDGMRNNIDPLVVMASTNKIEMMDEALSNRPCRFDRKIELNLPSAANLVRIYNKLMGGVLTEDGEVIKLSKNFTGSHVVETVNTAKILAAHEDKELADCLVEAVNIIRDNFFAGQSIVELQAKVKHTLVKQGASKKADDELLKEFPLSPKKVDEFSKGDKVQTSKGEGTIGGIVRRDFYNYAVVLYEINYPDGSRELLRPSKVKKGSKKTAEDYKCKNCGATDKMVNIDGLCPDCADEKEVNDLKKDFAVGDKVTVDRYKGEKGSDKAINEYAQRIMRPVSMWSPKDWSNFKAEQRELLDRDKNVDASKKLNINDILEKDASKKTSANAFAVGDKVTVDRYKGAKGTIKEKAKHTSEELGREETLLVLFADGKQEWFAPSELKKDASKKLNINDILEKDASKKTSMNKGDKYIDPEGGEWKVVSLRDKDDDSGWQDADLKNSAGEIITVGEPELKGQWEREASKKANKVIRRMVRKSGKNCPKCGKPTLEIRENGTKTLNVWMECKYCGWLEETDKRRTDIEYNVREKWKGDEKQVERKQVQDTKLKDHTPAKPKKQVGLVASKKTALKPYDVAVGDTVKVDNAFAEVLAIIDDTVVVKSDDFAEGKRLVKLDQLKGIGTKEKKAGGKKTSKEDRKSFLVDKKNKSKKGEAYFETSHTKEEALSYALKELKYGSKKLTLDNIQIYKEDPSYWVENVSGMLVKRKAKKKAGGFEGFEPKDGWPADAPTAKEPTPEYLEWLKAHPPLEGMVWNEEKKKWEDKKIAKEPTKCKNCGALLAPEEYYLCRECRDSLKQEERMASNKKKASSIMEKLINEARQTAKRDRKKEKLELKWSDTAQGARDAFKELADVDEFPRWEQAQVIADPNIEYVWAIVDKDKEWAAVVYLKDGDFEEVNPKQFTASKEAEIGEGPYWQIEGPASHGVEGLVILTKGDGASGMIGPDAMTDKSGQDVLDYIKSKFEGITKIDIDDEEYSIDDPSLKSKLASKKESDLKAKDAEGNTIEEGATVKALSNINVRDQNSITEGTILTVYKVLSDNKIKVKEYGAGVDYKNILPADKFVRTTEVPDKYASKKAANSICDDCAKNWNCAVQKKAMDAYNVIETIEECKSLGGEFESLKTIDASCNCCKETNKGVYYDKETDIHLCKTCYSILPKNVKKGFSFGEVRHYSLALDRRNNDILKIWSTSTDVVDVGNFKGTPMELISFIKYNYRPTPTKVEAKVDTETKEVLAKEFKILEPITAAQAIQVGDKVSIKNEEDIVKGVVKAIENGTATVDWYDGDTTSESVSDLMKIELKRSDKKAAMSPRETWNLSLNPSSRKKLLKEIGLSNSFINDLVEKRWDELPSNIMKVLKREMKDVDKESRLPFSDMVMKDKQWFGDGNPDPSPNPGYYTASDINNDQLDLIKSHANELHKILIEFKKDPSVNARTIKDLERAIGRLDALVYDERNLLIDKELEGGKPKVKDAANPVNEMNNTINEPGVAPTIAPKYDSLKEKS